MISSGSTLLNLALSGQVDGGWPLGRISNVVGDRSTGKTLVAVETAAIFLDQNLGGKEPRVLYVETESAFDKEYAAALGLPVERVDFCQEETIEGFYDVLDGLLKDEDKVWLVILDSLDALTSASEMKTKFSDGSYGMGKQKKLAELFRKLVRRIEERGMHLMVISQVRDNITVLPFAPKYRRAGGKALDFYASHIVWLNELKKIKNAKTGRVTGISVKARVTKNKVSAPFREAIFPIVFDYGIDDIESMLTFLNDKTLPKELGIRIAAGGYFKAEFLDGDDKPVRIADAIHKVENTSGAYANLVERVQATWDYLEEETAVQRRSKSDLRGEIRGAEGVNS